jgi:glycosyltransferase involved in cell wall biosynthesis
VRQLAEYERAFDEPNPLVTVRIASYRRTRELVEVALPSVLAQTHENLEIIVVNDGPNPDTAAAVAAMGDRRVTYSEFERRSRYPRRPQHRWYVAGSPGMNEGIRRATGSWIAALDDDDEFTVDHVERLLALARTTRAELVYGALTQRDLSSNTIAHIFSDPPQRGGFSFQGALVHGMLTFFRFDTKSWRLGEPGDWFLARRMLAAGVRTGAVDEVVGTLHRVPYTDRAD